MDILGAPAVGCAQAKSREQAEKAGRIAREVGSGIVIVRFDCTEARATAARAFVVELAKLSPVRVAWAEGMYGERFENRKLAMLKADKWEAIETSVAKRGWDPAHQGGQGDEARRSPKSYRKGIFVEGP